MYVRGGDCICRIGRETENGEMSLCVRPSMTISLMIRPITDENLNA
jgi:hypothetical protein